MTKLTNLCAAAVVIVLAVAVGPALAGKGGGGAGMPATTIALSQTGTATASSSAVSGPATFFVTRSYPYDKDTIYVVNKCWDASGNQVVGVAYQVLWGAWDSLNGTTGIMPTGGTHCTAYVSIKNQQVGDALNYAVV